MNIQDEAVEFALLAGAAFQAEPEGEYRETIIGELFRLNLSIADLQPDV